jgi:hypothetical protein
VARPAQESLLFFGTLFRASGMRSEMCLLSKARHLTTQNVDIYTFPRRSGAGNLPLISKL